MPSPSQTTNAQPGLPGARWVRWPNDLRGSDPIGGKARNLLALTRSSFSVPAWFVVLPGDDDSVHGFVLEELAFQIGLALKDLCPDGQPVAVRSSGQEEDASDQSFAGQLESYLFVPLRDVAGRVLDVWESARSAHAAAYRREHAISDPPRQPAVIIQRMVHSRRSGVAFTADPVSGRRGIVVVNATYGTAAALVSGACDGDTYHVDRHDQIVHSATASNNGLRQRLPISGRVLTDREILLVARLARRVQTFFHAPQDVEWAMDAEGALFVLQARPITSIKDLLDPDGVVRTWDNSNIIESYGGVTTPMTFSFARHCYEQVYRQFCRLLRVRSTTITRNAAVFRCMLGFIQGRIYYNLLNWYTVLAMLPGYRFNRSFMEQMMGVRERLSASQSSAPVQYTASERLIDGLRMIASCIALVHEHFVIEKKIARFSRRINTALGGRMRPDLSQHRPEELVALYRNLESQLLSAWDAPLINDFLAMIFYGLLRQLCANWCADANGSLPHDLLANQGGVISAEPAQRIREIAAMLKSDSGLQECFRNGKREQIEQAIQRSPALQCALSVYIDNFGDRCQDELKLESPTLFDDPLPLFRAIGKLAQVPESGPKDSHDRGSNAEQSIKRLLARHPFRRLILRWVLRNCRRRVRDRENLRFERTRVFGRVRMIVVQLGHQLHALGFLGSPADVFFLEIDEVLGFVEGTGSSCDLSGLSRLRKMEHDRWLQATPPADRFETRGAAHQIGNSFHRSAGTHVACGEQRNGVGCSPGRVRGTVRIVRSTAEPPAAGSILVAEHADPSWVLLFPLVAGVILERGSVLSHVAIVGREMRIPMVASLPRLTSWLSDGDVIEMDGATGSVTRIAVVTRENQLGEASSKKTRVGNSQPRKPSPVSSIPDDTQVRYGQCWEDADVLRAALDVRKDDVCLSIASGGDNTLALLASNPARVLAVDTNPAQLACLALRVAAFQDLEHAEVLELLGWRPSQRRIELFHHLRRDLAPAYCRFWDKNMKAIASGAINIGRFERYLRRFRRYVLPLIHREETIEQLFLGLSKQDRANFYEKLWDTTRWRWLFKLSFSRLVMQCLARDPEYFRYAEGSPASRLLEQTRHALVELEPACNPYLQWILRADESAVLPFALRPENFDALRSNLDRLELCCLPVEDAIRECGPFDRLNLSDVFEYMSPAQHCSVLRSISETSRPGTRLIYWNMAVERRRPECLAEHLQSLIDTSSRLLPQAKTFFYRDLIVEEVV